MSGRIIRAIEWLLLEFEARMVTLMIWICWAMGITSDEVERFRDQQKSQTGPSSMTNNPHLPAEPRIAAKTAPPLPKRMV